MKQSLLSNSQSQDSFLPVIPSPRFGFDRTLKVFKSRKETQDPLVNSRTSKRNSDTKIIKEAEVRPDIKSLMSQYHSFSKEANKIRKSSILKKYKISPSINLKETSKQLKNSSITKTYSRNKQHFDNALEASAVVSINRKIHDTVKDIVTSKQSLEYMDRFNTQSDIIIKNSLMTNVTVRTRVSQLEIEESPLELEVKRSIGATKDAFLSRKLPFNIKLIPTLGERFGAGKQMCFVEWEGEVFIFGGESNINRNDLFSLDLKEKLLNKVVLTGLSTTGRVGSTAGVFDDKMYIYGGSFLEPSLLKIDLKTNKMTVVDVPDLVERRKNQVGAIIGRHLYVSGGINKKGKVVRDSFLIDLSSLDLTIIKDRKDTPFLARTAHCLVIHDKLFRMPTSIDIYDMPKVAKCYRRFKHQGIYVFGGINEDYALNDQLYCIKLGTKAFKYKELPTIGKGPVARTDASLTYCSAFSLLILHGGQDGKQCLNDMFVLDLENMHWKRLEIKNELLIPRKEHLAFFNKGNLYVLGGMSENYFPKGDLLRVDFGLTGGVKKKIKVVQEQDFTENQKRKAIEGINKQLKKKLKIVLKKND